MKHLTPEQLALAVVISVCENKSRSKLRDRIATTIFDDCVDTLSRPGLCPSVIRFKPGGFDPSDAQVRALCAETRLLFERIAPLVAVLTAAQAPARSRRANVRRA